MCIFDVLFDCFILCVKWRFTKELLPYYFFALLVTFSSYIKIKQHKALQIYVAEPQNVHLFCEDGYIDSSSKPFNYRPISFRSLFPDWIACPVGSNQKSPANIDLSRNSALAQSFWTIIESHTVATLMAVTRFFFLLPRRETTRYNTTQRAWILFTGPFPLRLAYSFLEAREVQQKVL